MRGRQKLLRRSGYELFGPGVTISALGERFWPALLSGKTIDQFGNTGVPHSFAHLPNFAEANIALINTPATQEQAWHMLALPPVTLRKICDMATPDGSAPIRIRQTPSWLLRAVGLF